MSYIPQKPYQTPLSTGERGIVSFDDARQLRSFGITSYLVVISLQQFARLLEAQLEIPKKKPMLPEDIDEDTDFADLPISEAVPMLLALLQRGWNKPRKDNVDKIE